ncbi:putative membrane-bound dehydrogenase domain-containing protein [Cyclobacterium lianum]|uniref:Putative membrane-bound dehydrogenase domain-containing protein n=1 Tax=Cyclobacterium lianum TaxID=388280 RepID=A0A1M7PRX5_9BACT|nr:PVC-type heme-binding CxxCH protein [Cyclobacterium lianum]SHN20182.1 putative membrane-bound dehydrogenase domain-containing protein [Cyclobacterium lianum]
MWHCLTHVCSLFPGNKWITPIPKGNSSLLGLLLLIVACGKGNDNAEPLVVDGVRVLDERLELTLMKQAPEIVTPIGIAVDEKDRVYVLESHTHLPPKDYDGPDHDIIKVYEDSNGDGIWDKESVFAEGLFEGLNIAFSPEGHLYAVTSKEVWKFYNEDGDGISERREKLMAFTQPKQVYAHAALLSITFDTDGYMYIGRGNTGAAHWILQGSDGKEVSGYGDGGNIIRSKTDGSEPEIFSTGYWNPFDLKFDNYGRLLVADNDPDSRGPNRLVHAVEGSDFGYQSLFGGSGIHPYLAWNGELPSTLPYAVPLGESPSGLLNANLGRLPQDYHDQMLCTIWEESNIVRIAMEEKGLSVRGSTEVIVQGGEDFRPVAFAADSKGNIYFTDWVERVYPNHGKGKIWKLSAKKNTELLAQRSLYDSPKANAKVKRLNQLLSDPTDFDQHFKNLQSDDPFLRHTAVVGLSRELHREKLAQNLENESAEVRMGVMLALRDSKHPDEAALARQFLEDPDPEIRKMALIWLGSQGLVSQKANLELALSTGEFTTALFETYLETVKLLEPQFQQAYQNKEEEISKRIPLELPDDFIAGIVRDPSHPSQMRAYALRYLEDPAEQKDLLLDFLFLEEEEDLLLEIIQTLANVPDPQVADALLQVSLSTNKPINLRAESLSALSRQPLESWREIIPLLEVSSENLAIATARYLRNKSGEDEVKQAMERVLNDGSSCDSEGLRQQLTLALSQDTGKRPDTEDLDAWSSLLEGPADPDRGRRVFYSNNSLCSTCHVVAARGGDLGPDLNNVGKSKDRKGLIGSILLPSAEMSPEWQGWYITMKDGTRYDGRQIDVGYDNIKLYTQAAGFIQVKKADVSEYGMSKASLMPAGLEKRLSNQDLKDLLAFLESQ